MSNDFPEELPPYQSFLERHPEHVKAIGMIAVEMANLELLLSRLLGALLDINQATAEAIYYSPQATGPRLAIVENVVGELLKGAPQALKDLQKILGRARGYQGKRNTHIHNLWGLHHETGEVASSSPPKGKPKPVPIKELNDLVRRLRELATEVHEITPKVHVFVWGESSREKLRQRVGQQSAPSPAPPKGSSTGPRRAARRGSSQK